MYLQYVRLTVVCSDVRSIALLNLYLYCQLSLDPSFIKPIQLSFLITSPGRWIFSRGTWALAKSFSKHPNPRARTFPHWFFFSATATIHCLWHSTVDSLTPVNQINFIFFVNVWLEDGLYLKGLMSDLGCRFSATVLAVSFTRLVKSVKRVGLRIHNGAENV